MSAATTLIEAWKAYGEASPEDAVRVIEKAINTFASEGQFSRAAEWQGKLADKLDIDFRDPRRAVEAYQLTAKWYYNDQRQV